MIWWKSWIFLSLLFVWKIDREKVFVDVLDRKEAVKDNKNKQIFMKNAKLGFFQRGESIVFRQKFKISSTLFFMQNRPKKVSGDVLLRKKVFCNPL